MSAIVLGVVAALGTVAGLFLGMPAAGFVLWPITRAVCRWAGVVIDPHDEGDPVMQLEGSLAAGLGMALGVGVTVLLVGSATLVPRPWLAGLGSGTVAGVTFGWLWRYGYERESVVPHLVLTAALAGVTAALLCE
ncbi:hypothetical protein [Paraliomyxa miuraensis]|uniref:hypothetical protein n=1 Tax=Paraliomyxa miuraensis TaxID=376150 RepID=UPI00224C928A|nr:hypothetical protein [Paraliomyxa miuraensis]MCX4246492.1 hypothetical protein [Paraliomyxa miuraensis]